METVEFTQDQRSRVDEIRDQLHTVVMQVLKEQDVDFSEIDLTEAGESIALEGMLLV